MSGVALRVTLVLKLDSFDVSHAFCQRALGIFGKVRCVYESLWRSSCSHLRLSRCRFAGAFQYGIIRWTTCWSTCTAVSQSWLSRNIGTLRRWPNGFFRPVLKHGPRSLGHAQVFGWQTCARNESNRLDFCTIDRL